MNDNRTIAPATGLPASPADRKAAAWIGVLFIIGTAGLVFSALAADSVLAGPLYLAQTAARPHQLALGACSCSWRASRSR